MNVIKQGIIATSGINFKGECEKCGCQFKCDNKDIGSQTMYYHCPTCNHGVRLSREDDTNTEIPTIPFEVIKQIIINYVKKSDRISSSQHVRSYYRRLESAENLCQLNLGLAFVIKGYGGSAIDGVILGIITGERRDFEIEMKRN